MNVLVTGGAGFIGSHTVDLLLRKGYRVRVLDNLSSPAHRDKHRPGYIPDEVDFQLGDVCSRRDLAKALQGIDAVYHMAARQDYLTDFSTFARVNVSGTALIYELIVNAHLPVRKIILASSQAVYGEGKYLCERHGIQYPHLRPLRQLEKGQWDVVCEICGKAMRPLPADESHANPHNQYAVSKYCQELFALTLGRRHGIPTVVLRYSTTQGPRQGFGSAYSGVLRTFALRLLAGEAPIVYEDGRQLRDYVYVGDVARANLLVLENEAANYQVFNVGGGEPITVLEYAQMMIKLVGRDVSPEIPGQFRFGDSRHATSDGAKLLELGWEPLVPVERVAQEYLAWLQDQPELTERRLTDGQLRHGDAIRSVQ